MSRTTINFLLDTMLLVIFVCLITVSVILRFVFPPGSAAAGWTLWEASYDQWCGMQFALISLLTLAVLIHVMLHWTWVCGVLAKGLAHRRGTGKLQWDNGTRTILGVGLLIVLLNVMGLMIASAALFIQEPARSQLNGPTVTREQVALRAQRATGRTLDEARSRHKTQTASD